MVMLNERGLKIMNKTPDCLRIKTIEEAVSLVDQCIDAPLHQNEFAALVCFAATMRTTDFIKSGIPKVINDNTPAGRQEAARRFELWVYVAGTTKKSSYLKKRRAAEAKLFLTPVLCEKRA